MSLCSSGVTKKKKFLFIIVSFVQTTLIEHKSVKQKYISRLDRKFQNFKGKSNKLLY